MPGRSAVCKADGATQRSLKAAGSLHPGVPATPPASTPAAASAPPTCKRVQEFTIGFWQDIYKGDLGRARVGLQYEYVTLDLFSGATVYSGWQRLDGGPGYGGCQHRPASEQQHRLLLAPLLSVQLSGTGQKARKAPSAQPAALFCLVMSSRLSSADLERNAERSCSLRKTQSREVSCRRWINLCPFDIHCVSLPPLRLATQQYSAHVT